MTKRTILSVSILALAMAAGTGFAQTPEAPKSAEAGKFYKLDFVVKEVEGGKILNARSYSMTVGEARDNASTRTNTRIPLPPGNLPIDVGVNIDCQKFRELQGQLSLNVSAEISSTPTDSASSAPNGAPAVRRNTWASSVIVPLRKPTLLFSSDDLASKRQMQLELTATPIQ